MPGASLQCLLFMSGVGLGIYLQESLSNVLHLFFYPFVSIIKCTIVDPLISGVTIETLKMTIF